MSKKQKYWHFMSIPALICLCLCFYALGGASQINQTGSAFEWHGLNMDIPQASESALSDSRLAAFEKEQQRISREKRRENMEGSSFEWLDINPSNERSNQEGLISRQADVRRDPLASGKTHPEKVRQDPSPAVPYYEQKKQEIMRKKRAKIEKELGINLSEYGYTKYASPDIPESKPHSEQLPNFTETSSVMQESSGFYGLEGDAPATINNIRAVIHGEHRNVGKGAIIKLRLLDELSLTQVKVPRNTFVYGKLNFSSGRAMIRIEHLSYKDRIYPFEAIAYDCDGFEGIYVPDNAIQEVERDAIGKTLSNVDVRLHSTSGMLNTAANALSGAIKTGIQNAARNQKITISSNYSIILKMVK